MSYYNKSNNYPDVTNLDFFCRTNFPTFALISEPITTRLAPQEALHFIWAIVKGIIAVVIEQSRKQGQNLNLGLIAFE